MKKLLVLFFAFLVVSIATAQPFYFHKLWDKRFGGTNDDVLRSLSRTYDGGFIFTGESLSNMEGDKSQISRGGYDYWVVKVDSLGNKLWDKGFGGTGADASTVAIQTYDKGYILGGLSGSGISGDKTQPNQGGWDYWIIKVDSNGNKQWDRRYGGSGDDILYALEQTKEGGYILGGYSNSVISGDKTQPVWGNSFYDDFWVVKTDSAGNKEWDKRFGGTNEDGLSSIMQTDDGGYILGGYSASDSSGDKTQNNLGADYWVVKIDALGNKEWDKRYGGVNSEEFYSLQQTTNGGYILGGFSYSDISGDKTDANWSTRSDYWIIKIDGSGNREWDMDYGGLGDDEFRTIVETSDKGYLLSGCSYSANIGGDKSESNLGHCQAWIVKTDSVGNKQWDKTIFTTGWDYGGYALQTKDGCYAVAEATNGGIGGYKTQPNWDGIDSTSDYWIMKFCMDTVTDLSPTLSEGEGGIRVYPNPFTSDLSITLKGENIHEAIFTITNDMGQVIYKREENNLATGYTKMLDLSYLANGVYFVEVITPQPPKGGEVWRTVRKVVKE